MIKKYLSVIILIYFILRFTTDLNWFIYSIPIVLIILLPNIINFFRKRKGDRELDSSKYKAYYISSFLMFLNPLLNWQSIIQLIGQLSLRLKNKKVQETKNKYSLPFLGKWCAINGGTSKENSHSWDILTQRFAYDFVIVNNIKESFNKNPNIIENYYCYNQPLLAVQDGVVVDVRNNVKDYQTVGNYSVDWKTRHIAGNYITIEHDNGEFSFYAHLKRNSMKVKKGDVVKKGQHIANCGNSGNSTEPHLHFQIMNHKDFFFGKSLIIKFENVINEMKTKIDFVEKDMIVENKQKTNRNEL